MDLKTFADWAIYDARQAAWDVVVNRVAASSLVPRVLRAVIYRSVGVRTGTPSLSPGIFIQSARVRIGRRSFVNRGTQFFCTAAPIDIGNFVSVGMNVTFLTDTHPIGAHDGRCGPAVTSLPIRVGDGCWIGANATVLAGVQIGPGCVIAAGAVVARDCAPDGLYAGVPARRIKELAGASDGRPTPPD